MPRREFAFDDNIIEYMENALFEQSDAEQKLQALLTERKTDRSEAHGKRNRLDGVLGLEKATVLNAESERALFLAMNYWKFRAMRLAHKSREVGRSPTDVDILLQRANELRNQIIQANLRLVYQLARSFSLPNLTAEELYSEGCLKLIRAVELFDVSRGFRFSTYATHTVRNHFLRLRKKLFLDAERVQFSDSCTMSNLCEHSTIEETPGASDTEIQTEIRRLFGGLSTQETRILKERFGFNNSREIKSYAQIAADFNLSKEWVRQITLKALERLRNSTVSTDSAA